MKELTLRVTEKEARSVGEGRWLRASWKSQLPLPIVCLAATLVVSAVISDDTANWVRALIVSPFVEGFLMSYYYFFRALDKAGKKFLWEVKSGQ